MQFLQGHAKTNSSSALKRRSSQLQHTTAAALLPSMHLHMLKRSTSLTKSSKTNSLFDC